MALHNQGAAEFISTNRIKKEFITWQAKWFRSCSLYIHVLLKHLIMQAVNNDSWNQISWIVQCLKHD